MYTRGFPVDLDHYTEFFLTISDPSSFHNPRVVFVLEVFLCLLIHSFMVIGVRHVKLEDSKTRRLRLAM